MENKSRVKNEEETNKGSWGGKLSQGPAASSSLHHDGDVCFSDNIYESSNDLMIQIWMLENVETLDERDFQARRVIPCVTADVPADGSWFL